MAETSVALAPARARTRARRSRKRRSGCTHVQRPRNAHAQARLLDFDLAQARLFEDRRQVADQFAFSGSALGFCSSLLMP